MKKLIYFLIVSLTTGYVNAEAFTLHRAKTDQNSTWLQLHYTPNEGILFKDILRNIQLKGDCVTLRLLGEFSGKTNDELLAFYKQQMPTELHSALKTEGNLHNPALHPLKSKFADAFKTTTMYNNIAPVLFKAGFVNSTISFEKFMIEAKNQPKIWVADITLKYCTTSQQ